MSDKVVTLKLGEKLAMPDEQIEVFEPKGPLEFKRTNTNDLMAATFPPLKAIVPGYVYGGFAVLAGRQATTSLRTDADAWAGDLT